MPQKTICRHSLQTASWSFPRILSLKSLPPKKSSVGYNLRDSLSQFAILMVSHPPSLILMEREMDGFGMPKHQNSIFHFQIIKLLGVAPEHTMLTTPVASTVCSPIDFPVSFQSLCDSEVNASTDQNISGSHRVLGILVCMHSIYNELMH